LNLNGIDILYSEDVIKLFLSLLMGSFIGIEREYRSKAAGFRTIALICLGSTLFTIVSVRIGYPSSADRVAANIITGIGFIGAGVIFKDGFGISGLTTATSIWITAALGMGVGAGEYLITGVSFFLALIILMLFQKIQEKIESKHQKITYCIAFEKSELNMLELEAIFKKFDIRFNIKRENRNGTLLTYYYDVFGTVDNLNQMNSFLINTTQIKSVEC
jgi:putative Mg2+ transporter-C (MgtC) family protein